MKPRDCFGVVIRLLGVAALIVCILYVYSTIFAVLAPEAPASKHAPASHYLATAIVSLAAGLYLLRGAPHLIRFAYPESEGETHDNQG